VIYIAKYKVLSGQEIDIKKIIHSFENTNMVMVDQIGNAVNNIGEILVDLNDPAVNKTEKWIQKAIDTNIQNGTRFWLGQSHHLYSQFFQKQNNLPKAREQLTKAIDIMKECSADGWVERYEKELVELS